MSLPLFRFALCLYNYSSILCLKYNGKVFEISRLQALHNVLKMPFVIGVAFLISLYVPLRDAIFKKSLVFLKNHSVFAQLSVVLVLFLMQISELLLCTLQVAKREKIIKLMNQALCQALSQKYHQKFVKRCINITKIFLFANFLSHSIQYVGTCNISVLTLFVSFMMFYCFNVLFSFVCFVKSFEAFIVTSIKELKSEVKEQQQLMSTDHKVNLQHLIKLSKKYQIIRDLVEIFNDSFGSQITLVVCQLTTAIVLNVSFINR